MMEYRSQKYPKESLHTNLMKMLIRWKECTAHVSTMRPRYGGISIFIKPDHKELLYIWFNFGKLHKSPCSRSLLITESSDTREGLTQTSESNPYS